MSTSENEPRIRAWAAERRLPGVHLERWLALAPPDRDALLALAEGLRMRTGQFVAAMTLLEEISVRETRTITSILARPKLRRITDGGGSAPGRGRAMIDALRAIRYPRLRTCSEGIADQVAALRLPASVRVVLPSDLSSDELRVELSARGGAELGRLLEAVSRASADLCRIADALGGADEI